MPYPSFTCNEVLFTDLPADLAIALHAIISLNTAYKKDNGTWVTNRIKILREADILLLLAVLPIDWYIPS